VSLAVVGTDTGVGKTIVSALILARFGPSMPIAYWKPVATGGMGGRDTACIRRYCAGMAEVLEEEILFDPPVSPHLAARKAGVRIGLGRLRRAWKRLASAPGRSILVEGVGGLLVPLNDDGDFLIDLIRDLRIPAVLVARTALGTINHTLLSLEALRARGIPVAGVVLNGPRSPSNREAIERFGRVETIAEVEPMHSGRRPSRQALLAAARRFDRPGALAPWLASGGQRER